MLRHNSHIRKLKADPQVKIPAISNLKPKSQQQPHQQSLQNKNPTRKNPIQSGSNYRTIPKPIFSPPQKTYLNEVPKTDCEMFLKDFDEIEQILKNTDKSVDELQNAGGISLSYSRTQLKENLLQNLSGEKTLNGKNSILLKFGLQFPPELNSASKPHIINGLPIYKPQIENLSSVERRINSEIYNFLHKNTIVLPKGFESYKHPLELICKALPEFMFTIGSKQHKTHSKFLAEHIIMTFQENLKNPLYETLSSSERKVLGITTLLHDINKTENTIDPTHPQNSAKSAALIMKRFDTIPIQDKRTVVYMIKNHHWLGKITSDKDFPENTVNNLASIFKRGNDFVMAKIFAESDLRSVNDYFFDLYGSKINSDMCKAIAEKIASNKILKSVI